MLQQQALGQECPSPGFLLAGVLASKFSCLSPCLGAVCTHMHSHTNTTSCLSILFLCRAPPKDPHTGQPWEISASSSQVGRGVQEGQGSMMQMYW
jgi:hypothetical protein